MLLKLHQILFKIDSCQNTVAFILEYSHPIKHPVKLRSPSEIVDSCFLGRIEMLSFPHKFHNHFDTALLYPEAFVEYGKIIIEVIIKAIFIRVNPKR